MCFDIDHATAFADMASFQGLRKEPGRTSMLGIRKYHEEKSLTYDAFGGEAGLRYA